VLNNAKVGANIAKEYCKLKWKQNTD
jgi:hypothetical protein